MSFAALLARLRGALDAFFTPLPQYCMVISRIALGAILFAAYANAFPYVQELWGPQGFGGWASHQGLPLPPSRSIDRRLELLHHVPWPSLIWLLYGVLLASSAAFCLGWRTRVTGTIALVLHTLFHAHNYRTFLGWALMIKPYLLYTILAPSGRWLSLDARRLRRAGQAPPADWLGPAWPVRLLQVHICTMYTVAGWARLDEPAWLEGQMIFVALSDRMFGRFDVDWLPFVEPLSWLTWFVMLLEPAAPVGLWLPVVGPYFALALMAMHMGLEVSANVGMWQFMMTAVLTSFLPAAWLARLLRQRRPRPDVEHATA